MNNRNYFLTPLKKIVEHASRGETQNAIEAIKEIDKNTLNADELKYCELLLDRFENTNSTHLKEENFINDLIKVYENYWKKVFFNIKHIRKHEIELKANTKHLINKYGYKLNATSNAESEISEILLQLNAYSLIGRVCPFMDLIIWNQQKSKKEVIQLLDETIEIEVNYLDNFIYHGWGHYSTLGIQYVGGWAKTDAVFCVCPYFQVKDDDYFKNHFLAHEAQHFSDYQKYRLLGFELEYRAKLIELALSNESQKELLFKFEADSHIGKQNPHAHANYLLLENIEKKGFNINTYKKGNQSINDLKQVAIDLYRADSNRLNKNIFKRK